MRDVTLELSTLGARHEYLRGVVTGLGVRSCHTNIFSDNVLYIYIYIQCCLHCTELQEQVYCLQDQRWVV